jgi:hypothetical protein
MGRTPQDPASTAGTGKLDDDDHPACTMDRAAGILGTTQGFLRSLGEPRLIEPQQEASGKQQETSALGLGPLAEPLMRAHRRVDIAEDLRRLARPGSHGPAHDLASIAVPASALLVLGSRGYGF